MQNWRKSVTGLLMSQVTLFAIAPLFSRHYYRLTRRPTRISPGADKTGLAYTVNSVWCVSRMRNLIALLNLFFIFFIYFIL